MINSILIKGDFVLKNLKINFGSGLNVISGVSGSGKSVFMNNILSVFGFCNLSADVVEIELDCHFNTKHIGILEDKTTIFRVVKDKNTRYFINEQFLSRKNLLDISSEHILYLKTKNNDERLSSNLMMVLDSIACKKDSNHATNLESLSQKYDRYISLKTKIKEIEEKEQNIVSLKEFTQFEIEKIERISPKIGEFEELMGIKKKLSKIDKISQNIQKANEIFKYENVVNEALSICDIDSAFFQDTMNELRLKFESIDLQSLEDIDVEEILNRIEKLSELIRKYGSIESCLKELKNKKKELSTYENIGFEKDSLINEFRLLDKDIRLICEDITRLRLISLSEFKDMMNLYAKRLYMSNIDVEIFRQDISKNGWDSLEISLNKVHFKDISSGELNRLRLAYIAVYANVLNHASGVILIDEIDSNLSGKEAMSIAKVLLEIADKYQIIAISHQPQLSSLAHNHYLVIKEQDGSVIRKLQEPDKIKELARMISGEVVTDEALEYAKKMRDIKK